MNQIRIGVPQFISVRPLIYGLMRASDPGVDVVFGEPGVLADGLARGRFDAALIPSIEYLRGVGHFFVEGVALSAKSAAGSAVLVSRRPLDEIHRIAVGEYSRTPIAAARIVLTELHNTTPDILVEKNITSDWEENYDAILCGGDAAMQQRIEAQAKGLTIHNIAGMWYELTHQPLVLALWVYGNRTIGGRLATHLVASRNLGLQNLSRLCDGIALSSQFESEFLYDYLNQCWSYRLGEAELQGLRVLEELALRHDLLRVGRLEGVETGPR